MSREEFRLKIAKEEEAHLSEVTIWGIPIWRIVRSRIRSKNVLSRRADRPLQIKDRSVKKALLSTVRFLRLVLFTNTRIENVVQAKADQSKVNGLYWDKISDPVIAESNIGDSCLIVQLAVAHPRFNEDKVLDNYILIRLMYICGLFLLPFLLLFQGYQLAALYSKAKKVYPIDRSDVLYSLWRIPWYISTVYFWKLIFRRLGTKRFYFVSRRGGSPMSVAAKKAGIPVYELQHGVTFRETVTYAGVYDPRVDPDYFLTFGSKWMGPQFGMPLDRLINIGWAYNAYQLHHRGSVEKIANAVLFISEPHITQRMVDTLVDLAVRYPSFDFHLRLHPSERITSDQLAQVDEHPNLRIVSTQQESSLAMLEYYWIVGEKSTVMYEAVAIDIKIGLLCYNGFEPFPMEEQEKKYFHFIKSMECFTHFLSSTILNKERENPYYSPFNRELFDQLL